MSRLDDLPADQKATLQLLLKQGKSYEELAALLRLDPGAVRERALNALDALSPAGTDGLPAQRQDEVSDYLLGQQTASARAATRDFLEGSAAGRSWARAVSGELRPLAGDALPDIPAEAAEVEEAFGALSARHEARERQEQSSKVGGVLLLLGAAALVAVLVVLIVSRLGDDNTSSSAGSTPAAAPADATSTAAAAGTATGAAAATENDIESQITLSSTKSNALAAGFILHPKGKERSLGISGQGFPATNGKVFNYAVWLYDSPSRAVRLGFVGTGVAASGQNKGRLVTGADPSQIEAAAKGLTDAKQKAAALQTAKDIRAALTSFYDYKELVITREPAGQDSKTPGPIVVSGPITKPAAAG
ncbi:MAG: hypothetical protein JWM31_2495 [Solirubrobacterales bacterium]|nr:hypothetical protein [Solirubrobacterales bacterium]